VWNILIVNCITNCCIWNTCVTWQGIDYKLSEDDTIVSKHVAVFLIINQLNALISQIYFRNEALQVSDSSSVHHQEFFTVHTAMVCVIQVCWQLASRIRMGRSSILILLAAVSKPVWHIPLLCVQWKTPDDGQRNCPKFVEFHSENKFEKLVHLVGLL